MKHSRRNVLKGMLIGGMAAATPLNRVLASPAARIIVGPARFSRPENGASAPFVPVGEYQTRVEDFDYVAEEWFADGVDDMGQAYRTQVFVRRPRDPRHFSGTLIVEPLHAAAIAPIYMYCSPYILRQGHGWACVVSQKIPLDAVVKKSSPEHYASLHIETDVEFPNIEDNALIGHRIAAMHRYNQASNAILAQVGAGLREQQGPYTGYDVKQILLAGHSQTGYVSTDYILNAHASHRRGNGASIYDGYFPSGMPSMSAPFGPREVPLVQVLSDGDIFAGGIVFGVKSGRAYRRADSDDPGDRYRLYELAGAPHMGTRYPPHNNPEFWVAREGGAIKPEDRMNSYPHHEMFNMALDHLVRWVSEDKTPPRADRIKEAAQGPYFAKDEFGNSIGGVRCAQLDVPHSTYYPNPVGENGQPLLESDGRPSWTTVGTEKPFSAEMMQTVYGSPANYQKRFNQRLDALISQGWFLAEDAAKMREEAGAQHW